MMQWPRCTLPYTDKRKQLLKMKFLVNEQNVSVMYIDINAISLCLDLNISQQDECFCLKLGMEVEYAKSNLKTSLSQIWVICELLPFVSAGQYTCSWTIKVAYSLKSPSFVMLLDAPKVWRMKRYNVLETGSVFMLTSINVHMIIMLCSVMSFCTLSPLKCISWVVRYRGKISNLHVNVLIF